MRARVLFRDSHGRDGQVDLDPAAPLYVGRALDCAVRTDDAMVSRKHSMIRLENGRFVVEDLGSSNGTHVNDVRVTRHALNHNDVVRCGSLWLRYVEGQEGGTARGQGAAGPVHGHPMHGYPAAVPAASMEPFAGMGPGPNGAYPHDPGRGGPIHEPYGGPPPMPGPHGIVGGDFVTPPRSPSPAIGDEDSIVVDMPDEAARMRAELDDALATLEKLQIAYDREVADGKRLRAEIVTHKDRAAELRRALGERDEVVEAHGRVSDELREELRQAKGSLAAARTQQSELADLLAARERQLARGQEEIGQLKRDIQDRERQLAELSRTKDEGWRKLNDQLTEIEHLREVITQQERMLEERRVGLISQDETIKELRAEREQVLRDSLHLKAEAEEQKSAIGRLTAQVSAIDEENRRLTQLLTELRGKRGPDGEADHGAAAHAAAVTAELKTLRIALKTVESDRDHYKQLAERSDSEIDELRERTAKLEVELRDALDERDRAQAGRSVSDEAMTRAELARHKAAEEAVLAARARDEAERRQRDLERELDKARRRLSELDEGLGAGGPPPDDLIDENRRLERQLGEAADSIAALEREVRTARAEANAARQSGAITAQMPLQASAPGHANADDSDATVVASLDAARIADLAIEVHDGINDVLSELRNNAMILHDEFARGVAERSPDSSRIMREAIEALLGQAEEAKGVLRRLRELVEFGDE